MQIKSGHPDLKNIDCVENVQRRATRMIPGMKDLSYEERLRNLELPSLAYRRLRGDLIIMYKMITHKYDPDVCDVFTLREDSKTRGHAYKLFKHRPRLEIRKHNFTYRNVDIWNCLPMHVI